MWEYLEKIALSVPLDTGIYSTRIRLQEGEEKIQAEEKNKDCMDMNWW